MHFRLEQAKSFWEETPVIDYPQIYAITDGSSGAVLSDAVEAVLEGGIKWVQYRDKTEDLIRREREADTLCRKVHAAGGCFIVNDDCRLAASVNADGVHLGKDDADVVEARKIVGRGRWIGVSCYGEIRRARIAESMGADYVAFGSVFRSSTKAHAPRVSLDTLRLAMKEVSIPVCAIGGINADNVDQVIATRVQLIAVISALFSAPDVKKAAASLVLRCSI